MPVLRRVVFTLEPVPPFRLDFTVWLLRRRPNNALDLWQEGVYRRLVVLDETVFGVTVRQIGSTEAPRLEVEALGDGPEAELQPAAAMAIERLLGTRVDLTDFYRVAAEDPGLERLAWRFGGAKPPRYPSAFEALVNGIACQQITLTLGLSILNRLAESFGPTESLAGLPLIGLPGPAAVARLDPEALRGLGFSGQKARSLVEASQRVATGELALEGLAELDDESAVARLRELRGVGQWTADYVLLRGFGRAGIFPGGDVGGRNGLQRWLGLSDKLGEAGVRELTARWQPYAGLVYFHLLLQGAAEKGWLEV